MTSGSTISEAERMDRHYRFQRFIYDATRTHYLLGRRRLIRELNPPEHGTVLEIGCGTAWNLVRAAKSYPTVRFYGLDISRAMLDTATASLARNGLYGRVLLRQGDAAVFNARSLFGRAQFDRVYFSYALSMIPAWKEALAQAAPLIAPGGSLHIVDFGPCSGLPEWFRRGLYAFLAHYTVHPRTDLEAVIAEWARPRELEAVCKTLHRDYAISVVVRRMP